VHLIVYQNQKDKFNTFRIDAWNCCPPQLVKGLNRYSRDYVCTLGKDWPVLATTSSSTLCFLEIRNNTGPKYAMIQCCQRNILARSRTSPRKSRKRFSLNSLQSSMSRLSHCFVVLERLSLSHSVPVPRGKPPGNSSRNPLDVRFSSVVSKRYADCDFGTGVSQHSSCPCLSREQFCNIWMSIDQSNNRLDHVTTVVGDTTLRWNFGRVGDTEQSTKMIVAHRCKITCTKQHSICNRIM
jgi:hypothetical protein